MYKPIIVSIVIGIFVLLAGTKFLNMRRPLPFMEIIPLDKGIAVVNAQKWFLKDLQISYFHNGILIRQMAFNHNGINILSNLINSQVYQVEITRTDLKGKLLYSTHKSVVTPKEGGSEYYVLVGASVGDAWNLREVPFRLNLDDNIFFGNRTVYQFDKTQEIKNIAESELPVSAVIIKECAAYFPRDLEESKKKIEEWVELLFNHGKQPMLATVVPVTKGHEAEYQGKFEAVLEFNDFIRAFGAQKNIYVLDLEKAVRISDSDRHLKEEFADEDGLHLLKRAYEERLDNLIGSLLKEKANKVVRQ